MEMWLIGVKFDATPFCSFPNVSSNVRFLSAWKRAL